MAAASALSHGSLRQADRDKRSLGKGAGGVWTDRMGRRGEGERGMHVTAVPRCCTVYDAGIRRRKGAAHRPRAAVLDETAAHLERAADRNGASVLSKGWGTDGSGQSGSRERERGRAWGEEGDGVGGGVCIVTWIVASGGS